MFKNICIAMLSVLVLSTSIAQAEPAKEEGRRYSPLSYFVSMRQEMIEQCNAAKAEDECIELMRTKPCVWENERCSLHEDLVNAADLIVPLRTLGITTIGMGITAIVVGKKFVSLTSFGGALLIGAGVYILKGSVDQHKRCVDIVQEHAAKTRG